MVCPWGIILEIFVLKMIMFEILHQIHNTMDGTCLIMVISLSLSLSIAVL